MIETKEPNAHEVSLITEASSIAVEDTEQLWEEVDTDYNSTRSGKRYVKRRASELKIKSPSRTLFRSKFTTPPRERSSLSCTKDRSPDITLATVPSEEEWALDCENSPISRDVIIYVDDYESKTFEMLMNTLETNDVLTRVEIHRLREKTHHRLRTIEEMCHFFKVIRALPELKELALYNFDNCDLDLITCLLFRHPTLEILHLHLTDSTVDRAMMDVLTDAPLLHDITLEVQQSFPLATLLDSKTLTILRVLSQHFEFEDDHMVEAMHALAHNRTLALLDLQPTISSFGLRAMSSAVEGNNTLELLTFSFLANNERQTGNALIDLSTGLSRNSNLKIVQNRCSAYIRVRKRDQEKALGMLQFHKSLEQFDFSEYNMDDEDEKTFFGCGIDSEWLRPIKQCGTFKPWKGDKLNSKINSTVLGWKDRFTSMRKNSV